MAYPSEKMLPRRKKLWDDLQAVVDDPKSEQWQVQKALRAQEMLRGLYRNNPPEPKAHKPAQLSLGEMEEIAARSAERRGAPAYEDTDFAVQIGIMVIFIGELVAGILFPSGTGVASATGLIVGAAEYHRRKRQNRIRSQMIQEEWRLLENRSRGDT